MPPAPHAWAASTVVLAIPFITVHESLNRWGPVKSRKFSYVLSLTKPEFWPLNALFSVFVRALRAEVLLA